MKRILRLSLPAAAAFAALAPAPAANAEGWIYDASARTLSWTDPSGFANVVNNVTASDNDLKIENNQSNASAVNLDFSVGIEGGWSLVEIGTGAFQRNAYVTNLVCPASLRTIGWSSFYAATALRSVRFNEGLQQIGSQDSFYGCTALADAMPLPSTLVTLGSASFRGCSALDDPVLLPDALAELANYAFYGTSIPSFAGGSGLRRIGNYAFGGNNALSRVDFPAGLEYVGNRLFSEVSATAFRCDVWWRNFPADGFDKDILKNSASGTVTHHLPWDARAEWLDFAETNSISFALENMPETVGGDPGKMKTSQWDWQYADWWDGADSADPGLYVIFR